VNALAKQRTMLEKHSAGLCRPCPWEQHDAWAQMKVVTFTHRCNQGMEGRHGTSEGAGIRRLLWTWRRNNRRPYEGEGSWREINTWMLSHESSWKAFFFLFQIWIGLGTHETRLCTGSAVCGNEPFIYLSLVHINHINFWTHTWLLNVDEKKINFHILPINCEMNLVSLTSPWLDNKLLQ